VTPDGCAKLFVRVLTPPAAGTPLRRVEERCPPLVASQRACDPTWIIEGKAAGSSPIDRCAVKRADQPDQLPTVA
jgi:hypothetical protein